MISTCAMLYGGVWLLTAASVYVAGRMLADPGVSPESSLLVSLGAGAVWPLVVLGAVELSSMAAYSKASSMRADAGNHRAFDDGAANDVIVNLR